LDFCNFGNGQLLGVPNRHTDRVNAVAITPDGRLVVTASHDKTLRVCSLASWQEIATFTGEKDMTSCGVTPDGLTIIAGDSSGQMHFFRLIETDPTMPSFGETKIPLLVCQQQSPDKPERRIVPCSTGDQVLGLEPPVGDSRPKDTASHYNPWGQYGNADPIADPLYQRSLAIWIKELGPQPPDLVGSLSDLALLYEAQGKDADPEFLSQWASAILERAPDQEDLDVAGCLMNLVALFQDQYEKAEPFYLRALVIWEKALGAEHPDLASRLKDLARRYDVQNQYKKAEPLYLRALAIWEKALGAEHPDLAPHLKDLARHYDVQGQDEKAEPLYLRALAIWEKAQGANHSDDSGLHYLAVFYYYEGQYEKAASVCQRALAIQEKALGQEHPVVASSLNNLAVFYDVQGRYGKAESLFQRALAIWEKALDPNVAMCLENYARMLRKMGRLEEAAPLESRAKAIRAKTA
jgi:tetratricopeptide (TPR) repeat protein